MANVQEGPFPFVSAAIKFTKWNDINALPKALTKLEFLPKGTWSLPDSLTVSAWTKNQSMPNCTEVVLPEGLTTLGKNAFCNIPLTAINFPGSLTKLDSFCLNGTRLSTISLI